LLRIRILMENCNLKQNKEQIKIHVFQIVY